MVWGVLIGGDDWLRSETLSITNCSSTRVTKKARSQQTVNLRPYIPRRSIIDSQGNVLATDNLAHILYAHPIQFKITKKEVAAKLSSILEDKTPRQLIEQFKQRNTGILIARGLTEGPGS